MSCIPSWFWGPVVTLEDCLAAFFAADELKGEFSLVGSDSTKQGKPHGGVFLARFGGGLNPLESLPQCFTYRLAVPKLGSSASLSRSEFSHLLRGGKSG